jgi:uncharacterized membrane protein
MLWGMVAGARDRKVAGWVVYVLGGGMLAWTHGIGIYYVAIAAALWITLPRANGDRWRWRPWLVANAAIALMFAPWVPVAIRNTREVATSFWVSPSAPEPPTLTTIYQLTVSPIPSPGFLLRSLLGLDVSPTLGAGLWIVPIFAALALAIALGVRSRNRALSFVVVAYLAPIGVFTALSLMVRPILHPPHSVARGRAAGAIARPRHRHRPVAARACGDRHAGGSRTAAGDCFRSSGRCGPH